MLKIMDWKLKQTSKIIFIFDTKGDLINMNEKLKDHLLRLNFKTLSTGLKPFGFADF